jgi:hypothetical protein
MVNKKPMYRKIVWILALILRTEIPTDMYDESPDDQGEDYCPMRLTLCILIETYRRFVATYYLYFQSRNVHPTKIYGVTFYKLVYFSHHRKDPVRTPQKTICISVIKTNQFMM